MRHPVLMTFAMMSFIGIGLFGAACAKNDEPEIEAITGTAPTDPDQDGGPNKTITIPSKPKPPKDAGVTSNPPVDAGPADTGAPPAGDDDDDDDDGQPDCPQDQSYLMKYSVAQMMGGTTCTSGGDECGSSECCFVYPIPGLGADNYCLPQ